MKENPTKVSVTIVNYDSIRYICTYHRWPRNSLSPSRHSPGNFGAGNLPSGRQGFVTKKNLGNVCVFLNEILWNFTEKHRFPQGSPGFHEILCFGDSWGISPLLRKSRGIPMDPWAKDLHLKNLGVGISKKSSPLHLCRLSSVRFPL